MADDASPRPPLTGPSSTPEKPDFSPTSVDPTSPPPPPQPSQSTSSTSTSPSPPIRELKNDPTRTGFDPSTTWWVNAFRILTGRMTTEGQFHYREWRYAVHEKRDCEICEEARDWALKRSPTVRFMSDRIRELGGNLDSSNILCRRCPARLDEDGNVHRQGGGFSPAHGIMLCANEMQGKKQVEDVLAHEMVHAWDLLRWKMDPTGMKNLKHAACTEIRASMLSGECRYIRWGSEARSRGDYTIMQQFQNCVRQRAILSMIARPRIKDVDHATKVVNQVWDSCFADTRPFDEVYR